MAQHRNGWGAILLILLGILLIYLGWRNFASLTAWWHNLLSTLGGGHIIAAPPTKKRTTPSQPKTAQQPQSATSPNPLLKSLKGIEAWWKGRVKSFENQTIHPGGAAVPPIGIPGISGAPVEVPVP